MYSILDAQLTEGEMQMQVVGIVGSPRKGMNTDVLVQAILDGCKRGGGAELPDTPNA